MPAGSNFVNVRFVAEGELIVTGKSERFEEIEAIHMSIAPAPDVASASLTAALSATGELVPLKDQVEHSLPGPGSGDWSTSLTYGSPHDFSPGMIVVIAGTALRRDPNDPQNQLPPDVWVSCSGILGVNQPKEAVPDPFVTP